MGAKEDAETAAKWEAIGAKFGQAAADFINGLGAGISDTIRGLYASAYGKCRRCDKPLGGESPDKICETCHADEVLAAANGGKNGGDA